MDIFLWKMFPRYNRIIIIMISHLTPCRSSAPPGSSAGRSSGRHRTSQMSADCLMWQLSCNCKYSRSPGTSQLSHFRLSMTPLGIPDPPCSSRSFFHQCSMSARETEPVLLSSRTSNKVLIAVTNLTGSPSRARDLPVMM